jgi:hypothetical protein
MVSQPVDPLKLWILLWRTGRAFLLCDRFIRFCFIDPSMNYICTSIDPHGSGIDLRCSMFVPAPRKINIEMTCSRHMTRVMISIERELCQVLALHLPSVPHRTWIESIHLPAVSAFLVC